MNLLAGVFGLKRAPGLRRPVSPHPGPLPRGEGDTCAARDETPDPGRTALSSAVPSPQAEGGTCAARDEAPDLCRTTRPSVVPSPRGEGQGEGDRDTASLDSLFSAAPPARANTGTLPANVAGRSADILVRPAPGCTAWSRRRGMSALLLLA